MLKIYCTVSVVFSSGILSCLRVLNRSPARLSVSDDVRVGALHIQQKTISRRQNIFSDARKVVLADFLSE